MLEDSVVGFVCLFIRGTLFHAWYVLNELVWSLRTLNS